MRLNFLSSLFQQGDRGEAGPAGPAGFAGPPVRTSDIDRFRCFISRHITAQACVELVFLLPSNLRVLMVSLVLRESLVTLDPRETLVPPDLVDLLELLDLR